MTEEFINELKNDKIPVLEEFYTIQGEGFNSGKAAYFVRLGGCDLACRWCDSKESWVPRLDQFVKINDIIDRVRHTTADTIVVTGGEPLIYNFNRFTELSRQAGITTMIETSGAHEFSGVWDWICVSPKKQMPPLPEFYQLANELKVVIFDETDLEWAEKCSQKVSGRCELYLQPEWSQFKRTGDMVVDYVKKNPKWKISVQMHKFLRIP